MKAGDILEVNYELTMMDTKFHVGKQVIQVLDGTCEIEYTDDEYPDLKQTPQHIKKVEQVYEEIGDLSRKNGGYLTTKQIDHYFSKMIFKDKLSGTS